LNEPQAATHEAATLEPPATDRTSIEQPGDAPTQPSPTAAQLRRFIKSRPYVPLHELRRRFELNGDLDEVAGVEITGRGIVYVGLPMRESLLLAGLVRDGDVGLEISQDPTVPIVVGVYPMRPITRN
jgi:hypothetical protein